MILACENEREPERIVTVAPGVIFSSDVIGRSAVCGRDAPAPKPKRAPANVPSTDGAPPREVDERQQDLF